MTTLKFKTNIKCNGCIATVTPYLESETSIQKWNVDIRNPEKILTVEGEQINQNSVEEKVREAGFLIEAI